MRSESVSSGRINLNRLGRPNETLRVGDSSDSSADISKSLSYHLSDAKARYWF